MPDIIIVGLYLLGTLIAGVFAGKNIKSMKDFSIANRNYSTMILVAGFAATIIGGGSTIGVSEKVFTAGVVFIAILCISQPIARLFTSFVVVPRMGRFGGMISVGDMMDSFYGRPGRVVTGICVTLNAVGSVGAQVLAVGYVFNFLLGIPQLWGVLIGCGIVVIYSSLGGIRAVMRTDVIQFAVLIIAIPIICMIGLDTVGGFSALIEKLPGTHLELLPSNESPWKYAMLFLIFALPGLDAAEMQRILMARSIKQAASALKIYAIISIPFFFLVGIIGLVAFAIAPSINGHASLPYLIKSILPVGLKGLAISGMLAVIMSTADSYLNTASIAFVHDVIKPLKKGMLSDRLELKLTRIATFFLGCLTIVAGLYFTSVLDLVISLLYLWLPLITAPLYAGIFRLRGNAKTFLISGACGVLTSILWNVLLEPKIGVDGLIPGFIANALNTIAFHFILKKKGVLLKDIVVQEEPVDTDMYDDEPLPWWVRLRKSVKSFEMTPRGMVSFFQKRVEAYGAQYMGFGVFAVLNYIFPYFMWPSTGSWGQIDIALRVVAGILCFMLIAKDAWAPNLKKYLSLYWLFTLFFSLPFYTTYMLISNPESTFWLINVGLALFLLALLVDWACFSAILPAGLLCGWLLSRYVNGPFDFTSIGNNLSLALYMYIFAGSIGLIFSRNRQKENEEKLEVLRATGGRIAHELRTPLAAISVGSMSIRNHSEKLIDAYSLARSAGLPVEEISSDRLELIREIPTRNEKVSKNTLTLIDMLLSNLRGASSQKEFRACSMQECIENAVETYPFRQGERDLISWDKEKDFNFMGDETMFTHVLFNLIKNALHFIKKSETGTIRISLDCRRPFNVLCFEDTGPGIAQEDLSYVFKRFYSKSSYGNGLGLAFCKDVMKKFGGNISCRSVEGEYTHFILSFPQDNRPQGLHQGLGKNVCVTYQKT